MPVHMSALQAHHRWAAFGRGRGGAHEAAARRAAPAGAPSGPRPAVPRFGPWKCARPPGGSPNPRARGGPGGAYDGSDRTMSGDAPWESLGRM